MHKAHGLLLDELRTIVGRHGCAPYRAVQVARWLFRRAAGTFDDMTDLPESLRRALAHELDLDLPQVIRVTDACDGTRKLLLRLSDGELVESVIIPAEKRRTLCLSSQVGCAMRCAFCATGMMGFRRHMSAGEIIGQVLVARSVVGSEQAFTNYVFMGMGEPLANYGSVARALKIMTAEWGMGISPRRITVSTAGMVPMMERLLVETGVNLAVSLSATTDDVRNRLIPLNRRYPLCDLISACRRLPLPRRRRITFEYVMLAGVNDSPADAKRLAKLLAPLRAKINLIVFNPFPGAPFVPSSQESIDDFRAILQNSNLTVTVRESRGGDIAAACGQLWAENGPSEGRFKQRGRGEPQPSFAEAGLSVE